MAAFMAGTKAIGVRLAQISVLARSSAMPRAALAIRLAVAGMTSSRSLSRLTSMCGIGPLGPGCHSVVSTGERFECERRDELRGVFGHDDAHMDTSPHQCAGCFAAFICGDAARNDKSDALVLEHEPIASIALKESAFILPELLTLGRECVWMKIEVCRSTADAIRAAR